MKQTRLRILYNIGILLLLFVTLYCLMLLKPLWQPVLTIIITALSPFVLGGFIAYLLHPLVMKFQEMGFNRVLSILIIYLLFFGGTGYGLYMGIPVLIEQMRHFSEHVPDLAAFYKQLIRNLEVSTSRWPDGMQGQIDQRVHEFEIWLDDFLANVLSGFMKLMNYAFLLAVVPFISFYFLKDLEQVKKAAWYMTPKRWRDNAIEFLKAANVSLGGYIRGQLIVCTVIGSIAALSFWLLGLQYPVMLGAIIAFTNIIPYFGPVIGAVPVLAIALLSSVKQAVIAVIIVFSLQFLEGNILSPYIVGKSINMHPLFIIGALLAGGEAAGIVGMVVAVPILAVVKVALIHSRDHLIRSKQP
ncbi:MAG TPA: AI-2E family transporter [Bacillaceae bacterium]